MSKLGFFLVTCEKYDDEKSIKNYLKIFMKVTAAPQITFYKEKFDTRINTTKQLWNNLNKIAVFF